MIWSKAKYGLPLIECCLLIFCIILISSYLSSSLSPPLPENNLVSTAIPAMTTMVGIMIASISFLITHMYSHRIAEGARRWMGLQILAMFFLFILPSLFLVGASFSEIAYAHLESAYKFAVSGLMLIMITFGLTIGILIAVEDTQGTLE